MELCYGCLHDFSKHCRRAANGQAAAAASDQKGSLLERDWDTEQDWDIEERLEFDCASDRRTGIEKSCGDSGRLLDRRARPSPLEERVKSGEGSIGESAEKAAWLGKEKEVTIRIELDSGKACRAAMRKRLQVLRHAVESSLRPSSGKPTRSERIARGGVAKTRMVSLLRRATVERSRFVRRVFQQAALHQQERAACCVLFLSHSLSELFLGAALRFNSPFAFGAAPSAVPARRCRIKDSLKVTLGFLFF
ncbi:MAG: hypothetical protein ACLT98_05730 [Eggerthellaceae bacterium]